HDIEVVGARELTQLIDLLLRIHSFARRHLGHQPVGIARNALQSRAQHLMHLAVTLGGLEKANAPIIRVAHQPGELLLPQFALRSPAKCPSAESEPRHLDAGLPESYPICSCPARRPQGQPSGSREHTRGEPGLQEITSRAVSHTSSSNRQYVSRIWWP